MQQIFYVFDKNNLHSVVQPFTIKQESYLLDELCRKVSTKAPVFVSGSTEGVKLSGSA